MNYTIYKDNKPKQTVAQIKSILDNLGIEVTEDYKRHKENEVSSVRITIKGSNDTGTNGKGTTEEKALASGYAEFMERLQTNYLLNFRLKEKDEKETKLTEIPDYFESVLPKELNKKFHELINLKRQIKQIKFEKISPPRADEYSSETTSTVPFYSLNTKKLVDIPINELQYLQTTTGMSAGNTYEEALVQAISELCERYSMKQILTKKILMPEIDKKIYKNAETITKLIEFIENKGYKITIKDASLGNKHDKSIKNPIPVICTVFEQKSSNGESCQIRFGAHPYLYIAIERTLTEFMQGFQIENDREKDYVNIFKDIPGTSMQDKLSDFYHSVVIFSKNNKDFSFLFSSEKDYEFNENDWIMDDYSSNKDMLEKLKKIVNDVYVRNYSFLGFPSVYTFIPELICAKDIDEEFLDNEIKISTIERDILLGKELKYTADELLEICEYSLNEIYEHQISKVPIPYIAMLCAIVLKDWKKAEKFYERMKVQINYNKKYRGEEYFTNNILLEYFDLKSTYTSEEEIFSKLYKKFENSIKKMYNIEINDFNKNIFVEFYINNITITKILRLISKNPNILGNNSLQKLTNSVADQYKKIKIVYNII